jgi:predicted transcriptional regulator
VKTFAGRLYDELRARCMTQRELAGPTGLNECSISLIVGGRRDPTFQQLRAILEALPQMDARALICGTKEQAHGQ